MEVKKERGRPRKYDDEIPEMEEQEKSKFLPFEGDDKLPEPIKKGDKLIPAEKRYFLTGNSTQGYKLLVKYRTDKIKTAFVKLLKPHKKGRINDRVLMEQLKKAGIPGAI